MDLDKIFKLIDEYISESKEEHYDIPYELASSQRSQIHEYVKSKGLYTESINLSNSGFKKIRIFRTKESHESYTDPYTDPYREVNIEFFAQYTHTPLPCTSPKYISYYIGLFQPLYDSSVMWDIFVKESKMNLRKITSDISRKIQDKFDHNEEYNNVMKQKFKEDEIKIKIRKDVYNLSNNGKYFLSLDIKSANFTVLRNACPTLFTGPDGKLNSWYEFVKQFTDSEFIARSKYFREFVFGLTGFIHRAGILQEILMEKIYGTINTYCESEKMILKMKTGDEMVYEVSDKFNESNVKIIKDMIGADICKDLHFRVFRVDQIESKPFFLKTFIYNTDDIQPYSLKQKIEFKKIPKYYMPQVIKWYMKEPIIDEDLIFVHDGMLAKYMTTIFDSS
jgi:hypothetical protein